MQTFEVGDRIKVRWDETGHVFSAKILDKVENSDSQTYDVLYEELVRGKQCIEKNITSNRICPLSPVPATVMNKELSSPINAIQEGDIEINGTLGSDCAIINSMAVSVALNRLFSEVGSCPDTWNSPENLEEMLTLYNELDKHLGKTEERLSQNELELLAPILNHWICSDPDFNFLPHFTCEATSRKNNSGSDSLPSWLTRGKGKQLLQSSRLTLSSSSLLLQLVDKYERTSYNKKSSRTSPTTTSNAIPVTNGPTTRVDEDDLSLATTTSSSTSMFISTFVSEEILERMLINCKLFLKSLLTPLQSSSATSTGTAPPLSPSPLKSDSNKRNKSQSIQANSENKGESVETTESKKFKSIASKKIITAVTSELLPLVTCTLTAMQSIFLLHTQNQRLCVSAQELCFLILQVADSGLHPSYEVLTTDTKVVLLLQSAQRSAISLLEIMCRHYRGLRPGILREFLPLLQAAYCSKGTMKSFQLNGYNRPNSMLFHVGGGGGGGGSSSKKSIASRSGSSSSGTGGGVSRWNNSNDRKSKGLGEGGGVVGEEAGNITMALGALLTAFQAMIFDNEYSSDSSKSNSSSNSNKLPQSAESQNIPPPPPPPPLPIVTASATAIESRSSSSSRSGSKNNKKEKELATPTTSVTTATVITTTTSGDKRNTRGGRRGKSEPSAPPQSPTVSSSSTESNDTATTTTTTIGSAMIGSSSGLKEINGYCSLFIYELLQRCSHKDTGSDYRIATLALLKEISQACRHPAWPMAPFLLNRFILKIVTDVTANVTGGPVGSKDITSETKRDVSSLACFYLEVLGSLGSELLPVIAIVKQEEEEGGGIGGDIEGIDSNVALAVCNKLLKQLPFWNSILPGLFSEENRSHEKAGHEMMIISTDGVAAVAAAEGGELPVVGTPFESIDNKKKKRKKGKASTANVNVTTSDSISSSLPSSLSLRPSLQELTPFQIKSLIDISADIISMAMDAIDTIGPPLESDYDEKDMITVTGSSSSSNNLVLPPEKIYESVSLGSGNSRSKISGQVPPPATILKQCLSILTQSDAVDLFPLLMTRPSSVMELQVLLRFVQCLPGNTLYYYFWLTYINSLYKYEGKELVYDMETLALHLWLRDCEAMSLAAVAATTTTTSITSNPKSSNCNFNKNNNNYYMMQMFVSKQILELRSGAHHSKQWHTTSSTAPFTSSTTTVSESPNMTTDFLLHDDSWHTASSLEWIVNRYSKILVDRFFQPGFEHILQSVLILLSDPTPAIRCKVIKTLAVLMKSDERLMQRTAIRDAVVERFDDLAISVREEAVKLVGSFILNSYDKVGNDRYQDTIMTTNAYLDGLIVRLRDRGVSVRKSVVTILRDILLFQPSHPRYTEICVELLSRGWLPKEEDSIKDVIRTTFEQLWFVAPPPTLTMAVTPSNPITPIDTTTTATTTCSMTELPEGWIRRLIEVVGTSNSSSSNTGEVVYVSPSGLRVHSVEEAWQFVRTQQDQRNAHCINATDAAVDAVTNNGIAESKEDDCTLTIPTTTSITAADITTTIAPPPPHQEIEQKLSGLVPVSIPATTIESVDTGMTSSSTQQVQYQHQATSSPVTQYLLVIAQQLLSVLRLSPSSDWMVSMLRGVLHSPPEGVEEKKQAKMRRQEARQQCELLVEVLVELMLRGEETSSSRSGSGEGGIAVSMDRGEKLVAIIGTIAIFCEAHPPFVCKHLSALLPYLKGDNALSMSQEAAVCLHVTNMLLAATAIEGFSLNDRVSEITSDLCHIALKFGTANVYASVHCLALLSSRLTRDISPLINLAKKCLTSMVDIATSVTTRRVRGNPQTEIKHYVADTQSARIQRCLIVLGAVCEHLKKCSDLLYSADSNTISDTDFHQQHQPSIPNTEKHSDTMVGQGSAAYSKSSTTITTAIATTTTIKEQLEVLETPLHDIAVKELPPSLLPYACVVAVRFALELGEVVQGRAVQALCAVFVFGPRMLLLPNISSLLTELLEGDKYSDLVHWKLLQSLKDMLMAEEIRLEKGAAECLMQDCGIAVGTRVLGPSETDSDATVAGSVLQSRLPSLLYYLSHKTSPDIRYAALNLIGTLLRQGMICPLDVLGELVALQVDPEESIRKESLLLLQIEDEKHPTFLDNRILEGISKGVDHQYQVSGQQVNPVVEILTEKGEGGGAGVRELVKRSIYSPLYTSCIQPHRRRRLDFLLSLIRRCDSCFLVIRKVTGGGKQSIDNSGSITSNTNPISSINSQQAKGMVSPPLPTTTTTTTIQTKQSLLSKPVTTKKSLQEGLHLLQVCNYLCSTLAYLPYDIVEEPLHIIHWIGRNVTLTGAQLLSDMRPFLELFGAVKRVEGAMQGPATGSMPRKTTTLATSKKGENAVVGDGSTISSSSYSKGWEEGLVLQENILKEKLALITSSENRVDMKHVRNRETTPLKTATITTTATPPSCYINPATPTPPPLPLHLLHSVEILLVMSVECRVKEALLRLKGFLKCTYKLSDERCLLYNPDDKPTSNDRADFLDTHLVYRTLPMDVKPLTISLLPLLSDNTQCNNTTPTTATSTLKSMDPEAIVSTLRQIVTDYNRLLVLLEGDPDDFSVNQQHPKKRKGTSKAAVTTATIGISDIDTLSVDDVSSISASSITSVKSKRPRKGKPLTSNINSSNNKKQTVGVGRIELSKNIKEKQSKKRKRKCFSTRTTGSDSEEGEEEGEEDDEEFDPSAD